MEQVTETLFVLLYWPAAMMLARVLTIRLCGMSFWRGWMLYVIWFLSVVGFGHGFSSAIAHYRLHGVVLHLMGQAEGRWWYTLWVYGWLFGLVDLRNAPVGIRVAP